MFSWCASILRFASTTKYACAVVGSVVVRDEWWGEKREEIKTSFSLYLLVINQVVVISIQS